MDKESVNSRYISVYLRFMSLSIIGTVDNRQVTLILFIIFKMLYVNNVVIKPEGLPFFFRFECNMFIA